MLRDAEIIDAIGLLAETEGIFTETAGGTTLAVTKKLIAQGRLTAKDRIVIAITGNGLKTRGSAFFDAGRTAIHRTEIVCASKAPSEPAAPPKPLRKQTTQ